MPTKSDYLKYLQCPKLAWLNRNRPDLISQETKDSFTDIMESGYEVEQYAYKLFPEGQLVKDRLDTEKLMQKGGVIFQPTIIGGKLYCRADIIAYNEENNTWDIYEIKSSTQVKNIHKEDLSFQKVCFEKAGYKIGKTYLVHINNKYTRKGKIDAKELFGIKDITTEISELTQEVEKEVETLSQIIAESEEPKIRPVKQCNNPYECIFKDYCLRDLPKESIYSIAGKFSEKKMNSLLDEGIVEIEKIPSEFIPESLSEHFQVIKSNKVKIDKEGIKKELEQIKYPIYYLDYETYGSAIPVFDGYRPYQNIVFQYSLHIQKSADSKLEHFAFLSNEHKDPTRAMAKSLEELIGKKGTPIAWNMAFEQDCNEGMAERAKEFEGFFTDVNNRMYDLMSVFKKGFYIHKNFYGSASLKKVLPAVVPSLSYAKLNIHEGMMASNSWYEMINPETDKKRKKEIYNDLLEYCELDTLAMVEILKELKRVVAS